MENLDESIAKLLETSTTWTSQQILTYAKWLQKCPKITTVRVNLLKTSRECIKMNIEKCLKDLKHFPMHDVLVEAFHAFPEVILIHNIDTNLISRGPQPASKEIIVDISCGASILRGAHIYGPGVLAMQSNTQIDEIVNVFADLDGACKRGTNSVYESRKKLFIGIGIVKMQRYQLFEHNNCANGIAILMIETISGVPSIGNDVLCNKFSLLQNLPSIICGRVLNPQPGEYILDLCAAPGNKTTHLAQLMNDEGILIALDKSERRVLQLKENVREFNCIQCYICDATKIIANNKTDVDNNDHGPTFLCESFDRILLDAPCSGSGNRPILATKLTKKMVESYPKLQKKLLDTAASLLKIGGILVYSTCSIFDAENEMNISWFLKKYGTSFELVKAEPIFGGIGMQNVGLNDDECKKVQRFGPNSFDFKRNCELDSIGFFICKFKKTFSTDKSLNK